MAGNEPQNVREIIFLNSVTNESSAVYKLQLRCVKVENQGTLKSSENAHNERVREFLSARERMDRD